MITITRLPLVQWTPTGEHAVLPLDVVEELRRLVDDLQHARYSGLLHAEEAALEALDRLVNDHIGQPGGGE